jgi:hypothetical protein
MTPFVPRKKNGSGDMLCEGCSNGREGRPLTRSADVNDEYVQSVKDMTDTEFDEFMRSLKGYGVEQGRIDNMYETRRTSQLIRAQAHQTPDASGYLVKVAHGNMDGVTVFHCPFCGSGQVVNSGTAIECGFCHSAFTVLVQPQFPMMPQTVDGQPYTPGQAPGAAPTDPGPAPGVTETPEEEDGSFGGDQLSEKLPDDSSDDAAGGDDSGNPFAKKDDSDKPPAPKESAVHAAYITEEGIVLTESAYMAHLAIKFSPRRTETLAEVKQLHGRA